jgi:hypothetical protein
MNTLFKRSLQGLLLAGASSGKLQPFERKRVAMRLGGKQSQNEF